MMEILILIGGYWLATTIISWIVLGFLANYDKGFYEGNFVTGLFISPILGWLIFPMITFAVIGMGIHEIINKKRSEKETTSDNKEGSK